MRPSRRFTQLDVFADRPGAGNPLAVVIDADGIDDQSMQAFANWTNLSETTFLLPPTSPQARSKKTRGKIARHIIRDAAQYQRATNLF